MNFIDKLESIKQKFDKITEQLSDPEVYGNQELSIKLSKERSDLTELIETYNEYQETATNIKGNEELIDSSDEDEIV